MKLHEIMEAAAIIAPPNKNDDKQQILDNVADLKLTPEYKEFTKKFTDVTTPTALKNGSLLFRSGRGDTFNINRAGQIRSIAGDRPAKVGSPTPNPDPVQRYIDCFKRINELMEKRVKRIEHIDLQKSILRSFSEDPSLFDLSATYPRIKIEACNNLVDLKGLPKTPRLIIRHCKNLNSIEDMPNNKMEEFTLYDCPKISSFEYMPQYLTMLTISGNSGITSFHNCHKHFKRLSMFYVSQMETKPTHLLGILLIPGITDINIFTSPGNWHDLNSIFKRHIGGDIIDCQEELIQNGFKEFAQL